MNSNLNDYARLAFFFLALTCGRVHAESAAVSRDRSDGHRVEVALACDETTSSSAKVRYEWDARFFAGPSVQECVDKATLITIVPNKVHVQRDKFSESDVVVLGMTSSDALALTQLTIEAVRHGSRREFVLVGGRIVISAFVNAPFEGHELWLDPSSDDFARGIASLLSAGEKN